MSSNLSFRRATSADIDDMSRIRLAVRENALSNPARITRQMYEDYLELRGRGWVALRDGDIIGFAYGASEDGSIWALFVDPRQEGQGAARGLMKLVVDWLFALGHERLHLGTQANSRADRFYAAQGWTRGAMIDDCEVGYTLARPSIGRHSGT
jgi:GNAT superfamily N-acetyltransferase